MDVLCQWLLCSSRNWLRCESISCNCNGNITMHIVTKLSFAVLQEWVENNFVLCCCVGEQIFDREFRIGQLFNGLSTSIVKSKFQYLTYVLNLLQLLLFTKWMTLQNFRSKLLTESFSFSTIESDSYHQLRRTQRIFSRLGKFEY